MDPLIAAIEAEQDAIRSGDKGTDRQICGPFLVAVKADKLAVITMHSVVNSTLLGGEQGARVTALCSMIAEGVQAEVRLVSGSDGR